MEDMNNKKLGRPYNMATMFERHKKMLEYQKSIHPFTPTLRELEILWYESENGEHISSARSALLNMVKAGIVITRVKSKKTYYYAIEIQTGDNENEQLNKKA